jgi:hypothetical protein
VFDPADVVAEEWAARYPGRRGRAVVFVSRKISRNVLKSLESAVFQGFFVNYGAAKKDESAFSFETQELAGCPICFFGHDLP